MGDWWLDVGRHRRCPVYLHDSRGNRQWDQPHRYRARLRLRSFGGNRRKGHHARQSALACPSRKVAPLHSVQPPYNLFERGIESDILPYCRLHGIATLGYGALCRGLLSGRMRNDTTFEGDDLRRTDPKFQQPRFSQYLDAVARLNQLARRYDKRMIHLAVRWMLDQGITVALWGARSPDQMQPVDAIGGWFLNSGAKAEIDRILRETIVDPVGPEFMAPPARA